VDEPFPLFILHWNQPRRCLSTIARFREQRIALHIVVIDNGSDPLNRRELQQSLPEGVRYVQLEENLGWGAAFNRMLLEWLTKGNSQICFISAHDALAEPECLAHLIEALQADESLGIVSPQYGIDHLPGFTPIRGQKLLPVRTRPPGTVEPVKWVHGTLMGFRRACLQQVGVFDERYFAYGDELEICLRANKAGWKTAIVWEAVVKNPTTSVPSSLLVYLQTRGTLLVANDYGGKLSSVTRSLLIIVNTTRLLLSGGLKKRAALARFRAVGDFLQGRLGKPPSF
jgi:N-acetylglucosaminyl-diphospho-decaprenol L-rhamnosyltransferase